MKARAWGHLSAGLVLLASACREEGRISGPSDDATRVLARIVRDASIDSATYASTRLVELLVASGPDTLYRRTLDFSRRADTIPSLPRGGVYALRAKGFSADGDSLWSGSASFTATSDTVRLDIRVAASITPCATRGLDIFRTWILSDTTAGFWRHQRLVLAEDSTYMSYTWGMRLVDGTPDTVFYGVERGGLALATTTSTGSFRGGQVRFNVLNYQQCSVDAAGDPCGFANYPAHITTASGVSLDGTWSLTIDSLVLVQDGQVLRYHH